MGNLAKAPPKAELASQSGPMLVKQGQLNPAFKEGSKRLNIRNGVGVRADGLVCFAITEGDINLYDFAVCFRDLLKCPDALYFDGSVSQLWSEQLSRTRKGRDLGPMVVVAPRK